MKQTITQKLAIGALAAFGCIAANATIISSTDASAFNLTAEIFPNTTLSTANQVSTSGNITLKLPATTTGNPVTQSHSYGANNTKLAGTEYQLLGDENFDISFSSLRSGFAMNYADDSLVSLFTLTFFNGLTNVGSTTFTSGSPFATAKFIGFVSDTDFNRVTVRESDTGNSNEYFQFFTLNNVTGPASGNDVPEPGSIALAALGLLGVGLSRRKRAR